MRQIEMTAEQLASWSAQYTESRHGIEYADGVLLVPDALFAAVDAIDIDLDPAAALLAAEKVRLKAAIDQHAETERLKHITPGAGQAMTYAQKAEEARLCLGATDPDPENYPLLAAEIGITAPTLVEVAQVVSAANGQWLQLGAAIEAARLSAKKAVTEAETLEDAQAAADTIAWP